MGREFLNEIKVTPLNKFISPNGSVLKVISSESQDFLGFGEVYFSTINYYAIKAWKIHQSMTMNLVVPKGKVLFVFIDKNKNFREEILGEKNYCRITVPPKITFGFQGLYKGESYILNFSNIVHNDKEVIKVDKDTIKYNWRKN